MNITDVLNAETQNIAIPAFSKGATYQLDESEVYQKFRLIANAIFSVEESDFATQDQKDFVAKLDLPVLARFKNTRYYKGLHALATTGFKLSVLLDKNAKAEADQKACFTLKYGVLPDNAEIATSAVAGFAIKPYKLTLGSTEFAKLVVPELNKQKKMEKQVDEIVSKAKKVSLNPEDVRAALKSIERVSAVERTTTEEQSPTYIIGTISKKLN